MLLLAHVARSGFFYKNALYKSTVIITSDKGGVHVFAHVCLSVCLLARLLKHAWMYLDEILRVDRCRGTWTK